MPDRAQRLTGRVGAAFAGERGERLARWLLAAAVLAAGALLLWLNRGTNFYNDELTWFADLSGPNDLESIITPHYSHLIGTTRLVYLLSIDWLGPEYTIMRVLGVGGVLLTATLFYVWAKRRIGPAWALLPAILLMVYGSGWQHVAGPVGFTVTFSIALGIGALIAVERNGRRSDLLACGLIALSVFTYTVGLAYLVGVAISVLLRADRLRRAWIFLVPLLLYATWWIWALQFDQGRTEFVGLVSIVKFFAGSMAVNAAGLTGVDVPILRIFGSNQALDASPTTLGWLAGLALAGFLIWRVLRGNVPRSFWASLGVLATFWLAAAIADTDFWFGSQVYAIRYLFAGSSALLLVLVDAVSGSRIRGGWAFALLAAFAFSLAMNLVFLRDGAAFLRDRSGEVKADISMLELANDWLPGEGPAGGDGAARYQIAEVIPFLNVGPPRDEYLAAVAEFGSPAADLDEIRALPDADRVVVDQALRQVYALGLNPTANSPSEDSECVVASPAGGQLEVPEGGMFVRARGPQPATMSANRFGPAPGFDLGAAGRDSWSWVLIPTDPAPDPWQATVTSGRAEICPVPAPP
jgi:hypothetical protein